MVQPHPNRSPDWWNLNSWRPKEALDDKRVGGERMKEQRGASEGGLGEAPGLFLFKQRWIFYFSLIVSIIVKSYEVDVNGALYALLCYLVLIKSGIVQDVPWPRKISLHRWWWHRATPQVVQRGGREHSRFSGINSGISIWTLKNRLTVQKQQQEIKKKRERGMKGRHNGRKDYKEDWKRKARKRKQCRHLMGEEFFVVWERAGSFWKKWHFFALFASSHPLSTFVPAHCCTCKFIFFPFFFPWKNRSQNI